MPPAGRGLTQQERPSPAAVSARTHLALYPVPGKSGVAFPSPPGFQVGRGVATAGGPSPSQAPANRDPHLTVAGTIELEDATASPRYSQSWAALVPGNHGILMASNSLAKAREVFQF